MYFILVTNFKKKLLLLLSIIILWVAIIITTDHMIEQNVSYTVSINSNISFSCPGDIQISNVYSKYPDSTPYIQASNSKYKNFIDFKSDETGIEFSYPSEFKLSQQSFPGSDILYHLDLQNKTDKKYVGFIQIWNMPYQLEKFLETSKQNSLQEFIKFESKKVKINGLDGYFWEYTVKNANENYKCLEVFLTKGSKLYRISYYIPEKKYTKDDYDAFWKIVNSLKVK